MFKSQLTLTRTKDKEDIQFIDIGTGKQDIRRNKKVTQTKDRFSYSNKLNSSAGPIKIKIEVSKG